MPFGDGSGPDGMGPMTGRGAGYCAGYDRPGNMNPVGYGRGRRFFGGRGRGWFGGSGRGRGFGRGFGWAPAYPPVYYGPAEAAPGFEAAPAQKEALKNYADGLRQELEAIDAELADMEDAEGSSK